MQIRQQKKPCKNKGECRLFLAKKDCPFSHDPCQYGSRCNKGPDCRYYHPQLSHQNSSQKPFEFNQPNPYSASEQKRLPVSKTLCRYNMKCVKRQTGECRFMHSQQAASTFSSQPTKPPVNFDKPCPYQQSCIYYKNKTCKYIHDKPIQQIKKPDTQKTQLQSICPDFMFNRCSNQQQCPKRLKHTFIKNNIIKRLFFTTKIQPSLNDIKILYVDRATYYVFHNSNILFFMKFNQTTSMMEAAINYQLAEKNPINKLNIQQSLISYVVNNQIIFFRPKQGLITRVNSNHKTPILHLVMLDQKTLFSYSINQPIKVWVNGEYSNELSLKMSLKMNQHQINNIIFLKKMQIMGERIIIGGSSNGRCILWNKQLESEIINLQDRIIIDGGCVVNMGHPFCILSTINNKIGVSQIVLIDLICLQVKCLVNKKVDYKDERFEKIVIIEQYCFVEMSTGCVVVYMAPCFEEYSGVIAFTNKILAMEKIKQNKLLILQSAYQNSQGSLSIYKLQ